MKGLKLATLALLATLTLTSCEDEEQVTYQTKEVKEQQTVYVQDDDGNWITYLMFMQMMNNSGRSIDYHHYHYSTKSSDGKFKPYTPTNSDFISMKSGSYKGTSTVTKKVTTPVTTKKSSMFSGFKSSAPTSSTSKASSFSSGKSSSLGGSSSRASGIGG